MESNPKFIKDFSKEESSQERDQLAKKIKDTRAEYFRSKDSNPELDQVQETKDIIEKISAFLPAKIIDFLRYMKVKSSMPENVKQEESQTVNLSESMKEAKKAIDEFYTKQKNKWAVSPYSKEDIVQYFSPEHLASLSLEEYILLLRRFPSQMITHVTRQGIRDHVGAVNHHAGMNKLWNGFKDVVEDGALKSSFAIHVTDNAKEEAIVNFLNLKNKTREEAVRDIDYIVGEDTQNHHGSFADRRSVHFATEEVADIHYGAETGNEIFFAYPSALIASQYVFSGQLTEANGGYHNNLWVFADEKGGLNLDVGLVFIPKDVQVDPETGSKYELNENLEPIENSELVDVIHKVVSLDGFKEFAKQYRDILGNTHLDITTFFSGSYSTTIGTKDVEEKITEGLYILENTFSVTDKNIQEAVLDYGFLNSVLNLRENEKALNDSILNRLKTLGRVFRLAKNTVSSKEYWEGYFKEHPGVKKPSKIVYYEGGDPTLALKNWRAEHNLFKRAEGKNLGFEEHDVDLSSPDQVKDKIPFVGRFKSLANDIVDRYYDDVA